MQGHAADAYSYLQGINGFVADVNSTIASFDPQFVQKATGRDILKQEVTTKKGLVATRQEPPRHARNRSGSKPRSLTPWEC